MSRAHSGFSLAEVMIAVGILTFAIIGLVTMLPLGLNLAQNSTEEIQAANLISAVACDLQSTPAENSESSNFKLKPIPWRQTVVDGPVAPDSTITTGESCFFYFADGQTPVSDPGKARFRLTIQYVRVPGQPESGTGELLPLGSPASMEAIAVVSWPVAAEPLLSSGVPPQGQVEAYLTFPRP